jgi:hypothetical protein
MHGAQRRQRLPHLLEAGDEPIVHEQVSAKLEGVAAVLRDVHPGPGGAHVGKDDRGTDLAGEAVQVAIMPRRADVGEDTGSEIIAVLRTLRSRHWRRFL